MSTFPNPGLAGKLLRNPITTDPNFGALYLIDPQGFARHVPDPETHMNLFGPNANQMDFAGIVDITQGLPLVSGAVLFKGDQQPALFLTDIGTINKGWVMSPQAGMKYQFNGTVYTIPQSVVDLMPSGPNWS